MRTDQLTETKRDQERERETERENGNFSRYRAERDRGCY